MYARTYYKQSGIIIPTRTFRLPVPS